MRAGQRLEASCKDGRFDVSDVSERAAQRARLGDSPGHVQAAPPRASSLRLWGACAGRRRLPKK